VGVEAMTKIHEYHKTLEGHGGDEDPAGRLKNYVDK
jgi:hypothetical protein